MPSKNPRLTAVLEKPLYQWVRENARKQGISVSLMVRDLIREAYEREEDAYWVKKAEERMKTYDRKKSLSHEQVFGKKK